MTRDEVCKIVCGCLGDVTVAPSATDQSACEEQATADIGLSAEDVTSLLVCIAEKLKQQGYGVILGKKMWQTAESVGKFCDRVFNKLTRIPQ